MLKAYDVEPTKYSLLVDFISDIQASLQKAIDWINRDKEYEH